MLGIKRKFKNLYFLILYPKFKLIEIKVIYKIYKIKLEMYTNIDEIINTVLIIKIIIYFLSNCSADFNEDCTIVPKPVEKKKPKSKVNLSEFISKKAAPYLEFNRKKVIASI